MSDPPMPKGMGLYADLLADPDKKSSDGSTISSAPVHYSLRPQEVPEAAPKKRDASLQFLPQIRRPQQKPKARSHATAPQKAAVPAKITTTDQPAGEKPAMEGSKIEYWLAKGNDHKYVKPRPSWYKDKKKKKGGRQEFPAASWDDIYDVTKPNVYRAYKGSEEQFREITEWKDRLYSCVKGGAPRKKSDSAAALDNPLFAPPALDNDENAQSTATGQLSTSSPSAVPPPSSPILSAELQAKREKAKIAARAMDARLAASGQIITSVSPAANSSTSTSPTSATERPGLGGAFPFAPPASSPPSSTNEQANVAGTISRAPVLYAAPQPAPAQPELSTQTPDKPVNVPKSSFGRRMLEKQGWKEGEGLGVGSTGITTHLTVQAEKRKKLPDSEGGGWATQPNMGRIIGGKRRKIEGADDEPQMSNVIKLPGMLQGLNVKEEIEDKNLLQELGDWFDENYGKVERIYIRRKDQGGDDEVFIKFTNAISALKAVNPTDILTFANNKVNANFFDAAKFDNGVYS